MLKSLLLNNVGPAAEMRLEFGERLNILTGDNGLGKSFLLDIIWWTLTKTWPAEINPLLTAGKIALPHPGKEGRISYEFTGKVRSAKDASIFRRREQFWTRPGGRPGNPGLVLYAMSDGSFAVWDPARNYWKNTPQTQRTLFDSEWNPFRNNRKNPRAYVFSPKEVWNGLQNEEGGWWCNGLIRDWTIWQNENKESYRKLKLLLSRLSPPSEKKIEPGELTRINLDDVRDMPTLRMSYGQDVPLVHASSGMRRIIALAYFLLWVWNEHQRAAKLIDEKPTNQIVFLIDEIESHLHPRWQQSIVPTILSVMKELHSQAGIQLITATHSPLIMSSVEPIFDPNKDAWFDLDYVKNDAVLTKRDFEKQGDANTWLSSPAFDLKSSRALDFEKLVGEAADLLKQPDPPKKKVEEMNKKLVQALHPEDEFLIRWQYICRAKGLLR